MTRASYRTYLALEEIRRTGNCEGSDEGGRDLLFLSPLQLLPFFSPGPSEENEVGGWKERPSSPKGQGERERRTDGRPLTEERTESKATRIVATQTCDESAQSASLKKGSKLLNLLLNPYFYRPVALRKAGNVAWKRLRGKPAASRCLVTLRLQPHASTRSSLPPPPGCSLAGAPPMSSGRETGSRRRRFFTFSTPFFVRSSWLDSRTLPWPCRRSSSSSSSSRRIPRGVST